MAKSKEEVVAETTSGKLQKNLVIKKVLIDLKGIEYAEVEKNSEE